VSQITLRLASRSTRLVLDASGCSGLTAECTAVEYEHRESFRTCIDGSSETGGPGTHDDDVVEAVRIDRSQRADAAGELGFGRTAQELSAGTKHDRQLTGVDMEALNQCLGIRIGRPARCRCT
jgi:hypothetical protein